jgi:hypothetical protein
MWQTGDGAVAAVATLWKARLICSKNASCHHHHHHHITPSTNDDDDERPLLLPHTNTWMTNSSPKYGFFFILFCILLAE